MDIKKRNALVKTIIYCGDLVGNCHILDLTLDPYPRDCYEGDYNNEETFVYTDSLRLESDGTINVVWENGKVEKLESLDHLDENGCNFVEYMLETLLDGFNFLRKQRGRIIKGMKNLVNELGTNTICVSDFNVTYKKTRIDYIRWDGTDIRLYAGNMDEDKHAEELFPRWTTKNKICKRIFSYF